MTMFTATLITLFSLLTCVMVVTLTYAIASDYFTSCFDPKARWMQVGLLEFCTDLSLIIAWYFYKEPRWIMRIILIFLTFWFGSFIICGYIILEIFKLSPEESSKDPIKFVLVKRQKRDTIGHPWRVFVVTTRTILILLGCSMLGSLVFVFAIKGSPFRAEVLSPCMVPLLADFVVLRVVVFPMWVAYKESSRINAFAWIISIICFGSMALCAYVVRELFYLSPEHPVSLILFNKSDRELMLTDPLLMENDHV